MDRKRFEWLVEQALNELPNKWKALLDNIAVVVEDYPSEEFEAVPESRGGNGRGPKHKPAADDEEGLLMGIFVGVPRTEKSIFDSNFPDRIVLFQKNIEAVCDTDDEIREEIRLTVLHELGHYFGLSEEELENV